MWTVIVGFLKSPVRILIALLSVAVASLCIFATGQYIALAAKGVKVEKQAQELKMKDATIAALGTENKRLEKTIVQVKTQLKKERAVRRQAQEIRTEIKEDMTDEEVVDTHNRIVDLFNGVQSE